MHVEDFDGRISVDRAEDLAKRLQSVRKGDYGAFILWHDDGGPSFWIHFNREAAYLHYFPPGRHPGYQPSGMTPPEARENVRFHQIHGAEADAFAMPRETLVPMEVAFKAAAEVFDKPELPKSVCWTEL